jgi:hypothetical protein
MNRPVTRVTSWPVTIPSRRSASRGSIEKIDVFATKSHTSRRRHGKKSQRLVYGIALSRVVTLGYLRPISWVGPEGPNPTSAEDLKTTRRRCMAARRLGAGVQPEAWA